MSEIVSSEALADARDMKWAEAVQEECGYQDGLSDFAYISGAWVDGLSAGVSPKEMCVCFWRSQDQMEFERLVWIQIKRLGPNARPKPSADDLAAVLSMTPDEAQNYLDAAMDAASERRGDES